MAEDDLMMIHMSVAPFINDEIIDDAIRVAKEKGNSISENPCYLCMGFMIPMNTVLRAASETITGLNTLQTFHFREILGQYDRAGREGVLEELELHTTSVVVKHFVTLMVKKYHGLVTQLPSLHVG